MYPVLNRADVKWLTVEKITNSNLRSGVNMIQKLNIYSNTAIFYCPEWPVDLRIFVSACKVKGKNSGKPEKCKFSLGKHQHFRCYQHVNNCLSFHSKPLQDWHCYFIMLEFWKIGVTPLPLSF